MGKIWVEVCLISARGLRRSSSFWKLQWYAVGWIDPDDKYCTKIDASGNSNPVWKTKFSALVEDSNSQDMMLHVEVYRREPIFLREKLHGTTTVVLKEFLAKFRNNSASSRTATEEVGSYQLRKRNSNKPRGFVDISIRVSEDREDPGLFAGNEGGLVLMDPRTNIAFSAAEGGSGHNYPAGPTQLPLGPLPQPDNQSQVNIPYRHPVPHPTNYYNQSQGVPSYPSASGPSYHPPRTPTPLPPPAPSNAGYIPTFFQRTDQTETYFNMPSSAAAPGRGPRPGLAMGVGAGVGALAAGAVIYGDDFMSGFDVPAGLQDASLTISGDPLF
ncbi:hypothetical protein PTKIN_Ptkin01aG0266600 [Pterospermum kingtungense]